jgi:hypothetical protein
MTTPRQYTDEERRSNLARLAKALLSRKFKVSFEMDCFAFNPHSKVVPAPFEVANICGTSCCALGHAPFVINDVNDGERWMQYSNRTMPMRAGGGADSRDWDFLFGQYWPDDKKQFAARAFLYLTEGTPDDFDEDCYGEDEYTVVGPKRFDQFIIK